MIIRRLATAVRRQDWFTVLIEIGIVVIGLLIGLQINNWNETRTDRMQEKAFLERLAVDVDRAREQLVAFVAAREERLQAIAKVENMYFGDAQVPPLSEWECTQVAGMHIINYPPVAVPSITEAFAGGRIDLLSEPGVIRTLIAVEQSEERLRTVIDATRLESPVLSERHPGAISFVRATQKHGYDLDAVFATDGYRKSARCHFLQTTPDTAFVSDVVSGLQANQWYVSYLKRHLGRLDELAAALGGAPQSEKAK
ncbi:MAG: DUF6090 family protein [Pseudomonadota bacterium]